MISSRRLRLAGNMASMGGIRIANEILIGKKLKGRLRHPYRACCRKLSYINIVASAQYFIFI
jgi:hypothetical protein